MLDSITRQTKEFVLSPMARLFQPVHPNYVTAVSLVPGVLCAWCAAQGMYGWAVGLWAANRILDGLDGTLARQQGSQSDFGGYLDILIDFLVYALIPAGLVWGRPEPENWIALTFLLTVYYVNSASWMYLSSVLEKRGRGANASSEMTTVTMPAGLIEGTETVVAYFLFLLLPNQIVFTFSIFAVLVCITIGQRLVWARASLD